MLRFLAQTPYEVYPRRVPPDWKPFVAGPETHDRLPRGALPRRGRPGAGAGRPGQARAGQGRLAGRRGALTGRVLGALAAGRGRSAPGAGELWAELDVTPQTGRRDAAPDRFRRRFAELETWLKKSCRRSEPVGWLDRTVRGAARTRGAGAPRGRSPRRGAATLSLSRQAGQRRLRRCRTHTGAGRPTSFSSSSAAAATSGASRSDGDTGRVDVAARSTGEASFRPARQDSIPDQVEPRRPAAPHLRGKWTFATAGTEVSLGSCLASSSPAIPTPAPSPQHRGLAREPAAGPLREPLVPLRGSDANR